MNPLFYGKIKNNKVELYDRNNFNIYLSSLEDKEIQVSLGLVRKDRSNEQNRYYWGVVIKLLSDHLGYTDEEMHDALKMLFLKDNSREIPTLRSTTELTTVEFEKYLENIKLWAASELTVFIPDPNQVDF